MFSGSGKRRFPCLGSSWRKYIQEDVYIPSTAEPQLKPLVREGFATIQIEAALERLALLGNAWASSWLAYAELNPFRKGGRDTQHAIQLCKEAADAGDAFAQYIIAWALILHGDARRGAQYLKSAAKQLFPPAVLDSVTLFWKGWGVERVDDRRILIMLRTADRVGHDAAWLWRFSVYKTGKLGTYRRVLGYVLTPLGALRYSLSKKRNPFSAQAFVFDPARYIHLAQTANPVQGL